MWQHIKRYTPGRNIIVTGLWWKQCSRNVSYIRTQGVYLFSTRVKCNVFIILCCHTIILFTPHSLFYFLTSINLKKKTNLSVSATLWYPLMSTNPSPEMKSLKMKYGLFRLTQEYHKKCLRDLFLTHYEPLFKGYKPNKHWTTHVSPDIMRELRLHLSWTRGGDVTHWTDDQIGKKIVDTYHKSKVLPFLISEIRRRRK